MAVFPGDIIKTSYDTGPYEVLEILRGCTCADYIDTLNGHQIPREPHMHFTCHGVKDGRKGYYLNGYIETPEGRYICLNRPAPGKEPDEIFIIGHVEDQQLDFVSEMEAG